MDMYIYYRAHSDRARDLHASVSNMQTHLSQKYRVAGALKRRPEAQDGRHTWMEIYLDIPAGFDAVLKQAVGETNLAALIDGQRHAEYFMDASSCA